MRLINKLSGAAEIAGQFPTGGGPNTAADVLSVSWRNSLGE